MANKYFKPQAPIFNPAIKTGTTGATHVSQGKSSMTGAHSKNGQKQNTIWGTSGSNATYAAPAGKRGKTIPGGA